MRFTGWKKLPKMKDGREHWENNGRYICLGKLTPHNIPQYSQGYRYYTNIKGVFGDKFWKTKAEAYAHLAAHMKKNSYLMVCDLSVRERKGG